MSLANLYVAEDRALIGVDTAAGPVRSGQSESVGSRGRSKLLHLPHSNLVVAGRGFLDILNCVFGLMVVSDHDFDSAASALPDMLGLTRQAVEESWCDLSADLAEVDTRLGGYLVGWSQSAARMSCIRFEMSLRVAEPTIEPARSNFYWVAPIDPFTGGDGRQMVVPSNYEAMLRIARTQTRWGQENRPEVAIGGRLVFATLTRHTLTIESGESI